MGSAKKIIAVRLLRFGEGGKLPGFFLHLASIGGRDGFPKTNHGSVSRVD
jgi:hypothetical protein